MKKIQLVSPVYKNDDKDNVANYLPISFISAVGKLFQKAVHKRVHNYVLANQIIKPFSQGVCPLFNYI